MRQLYNGLYDYSVAMGWNNPTCHLKIVQKADQWIVIFTQVESPINQGMSVTNSAEDVATQIVQEFALDPQKTLFIEHYPYRGEGLWDKETWDIVEFTWKKELIFWGKHYALDPKWRRIQPKQLMKLIA
jgi:hypothetical protein